MYNIRPSLIDIINISLQLSQGFFTTCIDYECIGYKANCIGAVTQSNQMVTNTHRIATIKPTLNCVSTLYTCINLSV